MHFNITLLPGDGIGPDVVASGMAGQPHPSEWFGQCLVFLESRI